MKYIANPVEVNAFKIKSAMKDDDGEWSLILEDGQVVRTTPGMTSRYAPLPEDYWVIQSDGYIYLNPKEVFERKYRPA